MTKKILLALIIAAQVLSLCHATAQQTTVSGAVTTNNELFKAPNGKWVRINEAASVGQTDGSKAPQRITDTPIQPPYITSCVYPQRAHYDSDAAFEQAKADLHKAAIEQAVQNEQIRKVHSALLTYIKAYNEAWATAHPGN